jgi:tRNA (cytidine/uridine-2'-O-)-methyltransferase
LDDTRLKRAGLDYHEYARLQTWPSLDHCLAALGQPRCFALTTRGSSSAYDCRFAAGDALLFGCETRGLPAEVLAGIPAAQRVRLPMQPQSRSLNLSNAVAVVVYEAWRQLAFAGAGH